MEPTTKASNPFPIAIAQMPITGNARINGHKIRELMHEAASGGARLIQFPEGALSGYAKNPIQDWAEVDWQIVREELLAIIALAAQLKIWVILGSAHPLTPPHWPHNSLYIISDEGQVINRYDKRICSYTEVTRFYTPGTEPVIFDIDGFRFGCIICVEINFPQLFMEYDQLGVDCLLLSAYPIDKIFYTKAVAHAAIHNYWIALSVPSECTPLMMSSLIGPDGLTLNSIKTGEGLVITSMDKNAPELDIALYKARPWRSSINTKDLYKTRHLNDARSTNRTCI
ncbi:MAG: carbon-nitrogen hydrolase family protein [Anaerolineaceae bacterium]|nr:carbon-nitrogen hydrolase family protein [Anaerolineaceae bacterium]